MSPEWWSDDIADAIHDTLRSQEMKLPIYFAQSPQIQARRYLVDWLAIICEKYTLCEDVKHLCVFLLDFFMDKFDIEEQQLKLVALGCLLVAAKFESQDSEIPKASSLNTYVGGHSYTLREFLQMELTLLDFYKWNIGLPTPSHFISYYMKVALTGDDLHNNKAISDMGMAVCYMEKYVAYFMEICTQDHCYREFMPSLIAASSIAASRVCMHISPLWSKPLRAITMYNFQQLEPVIKVMLRTHQIDEILAEKRKITTSFSTQEAQIITKTQKSQDYENSNMEECPQVLISRGVGVKPSFCHTAHSTYYMNTASRLP